MSAYLILENGMCFEGERFGAMGEATGELVFATNMTGHLETLTDPSYYGQIILQTFPLIGNYGVIPADFESASIQASAYIVKYPSETPSNFRSEGNFDDFLRAQGVVGLHGVDTRALTRIIRENGVMNGRITDIKPSDAAFAEVKAYKVSNPVPQVSSTEKKLYQTANKTHTVALYDFGMKENILNELLARDCDVWVFPHSSTPEEILSVSPDGIMLSNGPGDPTDNEDLITNIKHLFEAEIPLFGICLGHQLMALANGFSTEKLKYGHRGANQPAKEIETGRVYITSQNHGYTVTSSSIDSSKADEWFVNVNDGTCEGITYKNAPACSVQFHPEACGGPQDTAFLFDRFIQRIEEVKHATR